MIITADNPPSDADKQFVESYVADQYAAWRNLLLPLIPDIPPLDSMPDVHIHLHGAEWNEGGLTYPWDNKIEINWPLEFEKHHRILWHEFGHWVSYVKQWPGDWGQCGHGTSTADVFISALKTMIDSIYHTNQDAPSPDVRLRHVSNLQIDL